jgi:diguanylate cyclase (GGDEF)-like protein
MSFSSLIDRVADTTAHRDRDALDLAIARLLFEVNEARRVALFRVVDDSGTARVQRRVAFDAGGGEQGSQAGVPLAELPVLERNPNWRECVLLQDVVHLAAADEGAVRTVFPLLDENSVYGLLEIDTADGLKPREAAFVAGLLRIVRNHVALLDYGERDTLTGLLNRKTFETSFGKLLAQSAQAAGRGGPGCWLGVVDIDHFKSVNDRHGHLFGDEVLLLVSRLMRETFRGSDHLFRFGGEEFVIVLDATPEGAQVAFERLRAAVAGHRFPQIEQLTISLGYTQVQVGDSPAAAIERADAALYYAKRNGRNQLRSHEQLRADGLLAAKTLNEEVELF